MAKKMVTLKPRKKGQKKIKFHPGGLHESLGVPAGKPIPKSAMQAALAGKRGKKAAKQARFKENVLVGRHGGSMSHSRTSRRGI